MKRILFKDGIFHTGCTEEETYNYMLTEDGVIKGLYQERPAAGFGEEVSLGGEHVYPCLIDAHVHLLFSIVLAGGGFEICKIENNQVVPGDLAGIEKKIRAYAADKGKNELITANGYILTAMKERRLPNRWELDEWAGGRPCVVYNIDGHSSGLSSAMLAKIGITDPDHDGILFGEAHERVQGKLTNIIAGAVTPKTLAKGIANFENACAAYGLSHVAALEGNGDAEKDTITKLLVSIARRMTVGVRLYLQYIDIKKAEPFVKYMTHKRIGGCGDWEMDGASGSHSAAFYDAYTDTGETAPCYYSQEFVDDVTKRANEEGYQISSHAIGDAAIDRILKSLTQLDTDKMHRIEHFDFPSPDAVEKIKHANIALLSQPGYEWIDKRFLHTYEQFLTENVRSQMKFKTLYDAGVCICGSTDSPVQDIDPYIQMTGMVDFYQPEESVTPYQAFRCYTINPARAFLEEDHLGTLEIGKDANFFTADCNFFQLTASEITTFRPVKTYYMGKEYVPKKGTIGELVKMYLGKTKKI